MPTRLNPGVGRQALFSTFEAILNTNSSQNIFELRASIPDDDLRQQGRYGGRTQNDADRNSPKDIDFTPRVEGSTKQKPAHVFAYAEIQRKSSLALLNRSDVAHPIPSDLRPETFGEETIVEM